MKMRRSDALKSLFMLLAVVSLSFFLVNSTEVSEIPPDKEVRFVGKTVSTSSEMFRVQSDRDRYVITEDVERKIVNKQEKLEDKEKVKIKEGYYEQKRYFESDVHIYISGTEEKLKATVGKKKFEKLSEINVENEVAKINMGMFNRQTGTEHGGTWLIGGKYMQQPSGRYIDLHYYKDGRIDIKNYNEEINKETLDKLREETEFVIGTTYSLVQGAVKNLENANAFSHSNQRNPRTLFGQLADGRYVMVVVDGRKKSSSGVTAEQSADIMLALGAVEAVNFDGGGSSAMIVGERVVNSPSEGSLRQIGSALFLVK